LKKLDKRARIGVKEIKEGEFLEDFMKATVKQIVKKVAELRK
jgi:hypothetical protein